MNKKQVTEAAKVLIKKNGLINLSRRDLCEAAEIPDGSFHHVVGCNFSEFVAELSDLVDVQSKPTIVYKRRVPALMRKAQILDVAIEISKEKGYYALTRDGVASAANISFSLVTKYFGTMEKLKAEVMKAAIDREILVIILQGVVLSDPIALSASPELREKASRIVCKEV